MSGLEDTDHCLQFYSLMAECERVVHRILATPEGRSIATLEPLLKFPHSIDHLAYEARSHLAQKKLDSLKELLKELQSRIHDGGGHSAPARVMQTTNQPPRATITGQGGSSGPAPNIGTALPMLSCPPLPQVLKTVWQKSKAKTGVSRTDPEYYWRCCFDEIVKAQRALGLHELNRLFADRLK